MLASLATSMFAQVLAQGPFHPPHSTAFRVQWGAHVHARSSCFFVFTSCFWSGATIGATNPFFLVVGPRAVALRPVGALDSPRTGILTRAAPRRPDNCLKGSLHDHLLLFLISWFNFQRSVTVSFNIDGSFGKIVIPLVRCLRMTAITSTR